MESLWEGLARRPADPVMFARLREQLEAGEDFAGLIRLYTRRADAVGGEEALYLQLAIAEVWGVRLGDQDAVAAAYQSALSLSGALGVDGLTLVRAALKEVFWSRGDWRSLAELTEAEARQMTPGVERAQLWLELAQLRLAKLGDVTQAAVAYEAAAKEPGAPLEEVRAGLQGLLDRHPEHPGVFDALRRVVEANLKSPQDAMALLGILERRLGRLGEAQQHSRRLELLMRMAELATEHLHDPVEALRHVRQAHSAGVSPELLVPMLERFLGRVEDVEALALQRALLRTLERWEAFVAAGRREAELLDSERGRAATLMEIAGVLLERLGELDEAAELYRAAIALDLDLADEAVVYLQRILTEDPEHAGALRALAAVYRRRGDDVALLELLEAEEARTEDQRRRATLLIDMAAICAGDCGRPDRALEYYEAAADLVEQGFGEAASAEPGATPERRDELGRIVEGLFGLYHQGYYIDRVEALLRAVAERAGRWEALVSLLELLIEDAPDAATRAALHFELGRVLEKRVASFEQAMQHYQQAFRVDRARSDAIDAGRDLYRRMGNLEMVVRLYDVQLKVSESHHEAAALLVAKSQVLSDELDDAARALEALGRACALVPEDGAPRLALEALVRSAAGRTAMARLEAAYTDAGRPAEAASIYLMIAEQLHHTLAQTSSEDPARSDLLQLATDCDLRAYQIDPTGNARVRATERLDAGLVEAGRWAELVELLERRAADVADLEERIGLLLRLGVVAWRELDALDVASAAWQALLEVEPGHLRAYASLEAMFQAVGDEDAYDALLCWALDSAPWAHPSASLERRASLLVRLARRREARGAFKEGYQAWLLLGELNPNHPDARAWFEAHADTPEGAQDLFRLLERGLGGLTDVDARAARFQRLAALAAERLHDPLLAIDQHRAMMDLQGVAVEVREVSFDRLRTLYREIEQLDALAALIEEEMDRLPAASPKQHALLEELVALHDVERQDLRAASDAQRRLVELAPHDVQRRWRLVTLMRRLGDVREEVEALQAMLEMHDDGRWDRFHDVEEGLVHPEDLLLRQARLQVRDLGDGDAGVASYKRLLEGERHHQDALDELQRWLLQQRDIETLLSVLDAEVQRALDTSDKVHFLSRMAMFAEGELGDLERAVVLWRRVLEVRSNDQDALQALEELHTRAAAWDPLIEVCQARLALATEPEARARLMRKMGRVHRQREALPEAVEVYRTLLKEVPDDLLARQSLYEIHKLLGEHAELSAIMVELLQFETDGSRRHALMRELTQVRLESLDDPDGAIDALESLIAEHPHDVESVEDLHALLMRRERWPRAAAVLEKLAELATDIAQRIDRLLELSALIHQRLDAPAQAAEVLERVLHLHPANREALRRLEALYESMEIFEALARVRTRLVEISTEPHEQVVLLRQLADVLDGPLKRPHQAFDHLAQAHELAPKEGDLLEALYLLAERADLWPNLLEVLQADAARSPDIDARHGIQRRMAQLLEVRLHDPAGAFAIHREVFLEAPQRGAVLDELERLALMDRELWSPLIELYERLIERAAEADEEVRLRWRVAEIQSEGLGAPQVGFESLRGALALSALHAETLVRMRTLAEREALWGQLVDFGEEHWRTLPEVTAQVAVLIDNARLIEAHLEEPERALEQYVLAFQLDPLEEVVEARLQTLAVDNGETCAVVLKIHEVALKERRLENDVEGQLHFLRRMSAIHQARQEAHEAFAMWMRAFDVAPRDRAVRDELEAHGAAVGRLMQVALVYREEAENNRRDVALPFYLASARLLAGPLEREDDAIGVLRRALEVHPDNGEALERLETLYRARNDLESLVGLITHRAERTVDRPRRHEAYLQVAELLEQTEDPARAIDFYRRALRLEPRDADVLEKLADLYRRLEQFDYMARCLEQLAELLSVAMVAPPPPPPQALLDSDEHDELDIVEVDDDDLELIEDDDEGDDVEDAERAALAQGEADGAPLDDPGVERVAEAALREALSREARLVEVLDQLSLLYGQNRRPSRAIEVDKRLLKLRPLCQRFFERYEASLRRSGRVELLMEAYGERVGELDELLALLDAVKGHAVLPMRLLGDGDEAPTAATLRLEQLRVLRLMIDHTLDSLHNPRQAVKLLTELLTRFPDDQEALVRLADLYARLERWQDHIDALRRSMEFASGDEGRALALRRIAEVYEERLYHPDKAAEVLEELLSLVPDDATTLIDLGRLMSRMERWDDALTRYRAAVSLEGEPALGAQLRATIWCQMAEIEEKYRGDDEAALDAYEQALQLHPDTPQARQAIIRYLAGGAQWDRQISLLRFEVEHADNPDRKAALLWEIGVIYRDRGEDLASAQQAFEGALSHDGDRLAVLRDLADVAYVRGELERAVEVYSAMLDGAFTRMALEAQPPSPERLIGAEVADDPAFVVYTVRLANALERLGRHDEAAERFTQALRVRSTHAAALLGAGRQAYRAGVRDVAVRHLNKLISVHGATIADAQLAEAAFMLGEMHREAGNARKALAHFEVTLERSPGHAEAAQRAYEVAAELQDDARAAAALSSLVGVTADPDAKCALTLKLGHLYHDRLEDSTRALEAYEQVLLLKPDDLHVIERSLEIHIQREHWDRALELAERLVARDELAHEAEPALSDDPVWRKSAVEHLLCQGRVLFLGHGRVQEALAFYERASSLDPTNLEPLARIGLVLGQRGDFEALTERYDRFIAQLPAHDVALRVEVLRRLGSLLHEELGAHERALAVYRELQQLRPRDVRVVDALASLHLTEALYNPEAALEALRTLIELGDVSEARLRQILALYRETGRYDGAIQLLRLLDFCRCTTREEQREVRDHRDDLGEVGHGDLAGEAYLAYILPPLARGPLASLLALITERCRGVLLQLLTEVGVDASDLISDRRNLNIANIFRDVAAVLGMEHVELYLRRNEVRGVQVVMAKPPALVIGEDVFRGLFNREQRFVLGRALEMCRRSFLTVAALPPFDFMAFYEALFQMGADPSERDSVADERLQQQIDRWRDALNELLLEEDRAAVRELVAECASVFGDKRPTVVDWRHAAVAASLRVGIFLSGDPLVVLKRLLREEERLRSPSIRAFDDMMLAMETSREICEVVHYLISEDFIRARRTLKGEALPEPVRLTRPPALPEPVLEADEADVEVVADEARAGEDDAGHSAPLDEPTAERASPIAGDVAEGAAPVEEVAERTALVEEAAVEAALLISEDEVTQIGVGSEDDAERVTPEDAARVQGDAPGDFSDTSDPRDALDSPEPVVVEEEPSSMPEAPPPLDADEVTGEHAESERLEQAPDASVESSDDSSSSEQG